MSSRLHVDNDNDIELNNVRFNRPPDEITDASFRFTLKTGKPPGSSSVSGATNVSMPKISGTQNSYLGVLAGTVTLIEGDFYTLVIEETGTYADKIYIERECQAVRRSG